ncbi:[Fe-S]-binding protein, partial [Chloroflexota bacterium]
KMMSIGLGKQEGAEHYHRAGNQYSYAEVFPTVGKKVLETASVLFGLAIVENSCQETARVEALLPADFYEAEKSLLIQAKDWAAQLPFDDLDLLIVDEMGKEISGTGMDSCVIGRPLAQRFPIKPKIRWVFTRDLSAQSDGNALGIGMANFTTKRLVDRIDYTRTMVNAATAANPDAAKVPLTLANDKEAIESALGMIGLTPPDEARVIRIKNTLQLTEIEVSESLLDEVNINDRVSQIAELYPMAFDDGGNLLPLK